MTSEDEDPAPDEFDDSGIRNAADDPTAVWDEDSLRAAGLGDLGALEGRSPSPATEPEEQAGGGSIEVSAEMSRGAGGPSPKGAPRLTPGPTPAAKPGGLSWPLTIALAFALGLAVYLLVRLLK